MLKLFHGDIMSDLSNISCSELQLEILKRRRTKEREIRDKYVPMERQVKEKYRELKRIMKIDKDIIKHIKCGASLDCDNDDLERDLRYAAYQFERCRLSTDELFRRFLGVPETLIPEDIINMAEQDALQSLKNAMLDEIAKLY